MSDTLAIDIGGTKILGALVRGRTVLERTELRTDRAGGVDAWIDQIQELARPWHHRYGRIGLSVSGMVREGRWTAMNDQTLPVPRAFPLAERVATAIGITPVLVNDGQAAAWGEYLYGAGQRRDMIFLTVSTGIGGGIVTGKRLVSGRSGLAGHVGQLLSDDGTTKMEDTASGTWIATMAGVAGHSGDARSVFSAAAEGQTWAIGIVEASSARVAALCANLQLLLDPEVFVVGGGVGLAPGYLERITTKLDDVPSLVRPSLARAALGPDAGVIGVAALAKTTLNMEYLA